MSHPAVEGAVGAGDAATLGFYTREAAAYADHAAAAAPDARLDRFAAMLPPGGAVLDFGCGSGWAAARLNAMGFRATGFDGSPGLAAEARRRYGVEVAVGRFDQFDAEAAYDGVWASFSLLHDRRAAMPGHLRRLKRALRPGGVLYLGLKAGEGESRDRLGRFYTYFGESETAGLLADAGFGIVASETEASTGYSGEPAVSLHLFARSA